MTHETIFVAPHVGAWIEIDSLPEVGEDRQVAPHVGAWIEILPPDNLYTLAGSHPTWVRGLKFAILQAGEPDSHVAPHVGAWIEIQIVESPCRSPSVAPHVGAWIEIENQ